jgi:hypothetical protein
MDEPEVRDLRKVKQDELGPAAVIRTTTLKPKDGEEPKKKSSSGPKTEAQLAVAAAKARDEGRPESAIADEPKKKSKAPAPSWSESNKAIAERKIDAKEGETSRKSAPMLQSKNPLEDAIQLQTGEGLDWCACGRALYVLPDDTILCRDGHKGGWTEGRGPLGWEEAARHLRSEHTAPNAAMLMQAPASDILAFWEEEDTRAVNEILDAEPAAEPVEEPEEPTELVEQARAASANVVITMNTQEFSEEEKQVLREYAEKLNEPVEPLEPPAPEQPTAVEARLSALERAHTELLQRMVLQQLLLCELAYRASAPFDVLHEQFEIHAALQRELASWTARGR